MSLHKQSLWDRIGGWGREREREMVPTCACIWHMYPGYPKKEISAILVFDILLQVDLLPIEVAALSPLYYMSTEPG